MVFRKVEANQILKSIGLKLVMPEKCENSFHVNVKVW